MLFERTAIATKPDELIKKELSTLRDNDVMSPDLVFKIQKSLEAAKVRFENFPSDENEKMEMVK